MQINRSLECEAPRKKSAVTSVAAVEQSVIILVFKDLQSFNATF